MRRTLLVVMVIAAGLTSFSIPAASASGDRAPGTARLRVQRPCSPRVRSLRLPSSFHVGETAHARLSLTCAPAHAVSVRLRAKQPQLKSPTSVRVPAGHRSAGFPITAKLSHAPGNGAAIGGLKVQTEHAWFAARPSGTEDVYKLYAESLRGPEHLAEVQDEARAVVSAALGDA